ncbi:heme ABC transporter ATP-binding protein, partial [Klebsiella pneumoniae]
RALAGDLDVARGSVLCAGAVLQNIAPLALAQMRAVHAQHQRTDLEYTAAQVVELGRFPHHHGSPGANDRLIARAAMALTGVDGMAARICATLSGGEQA